MKATLCRSIKRKGIGGSRCVFDGIGFNESEVRRVADLSTADRWRSLFMSDLFLNQKQLAC